MTQEPLSRAQGTRSRSSEKAPSANRLRQISARFARSWRETQALPPARAGFIGFTPSLLQRSIVIVHWVPNRGTRTWPAQGRYLAREGAQQTDHPGKGFDAFEEKIDIPDRLGGWQGAGDPFHWKIIVSPEDGERLDLRQHARDLVAIMASDLGIRLEWIGIEHFDTAYPHLHVVLRGRTERGVEFRIPRDYGAHGIRLRSQELATQTLGFRFERDVFAKRERTVNARHYGELDERLAGRADSERRIKFESAVPRSEPSRDERRQLLRRLRFLSEVGLARRVGKRTFELSEHHRTILQEMQLSRALERSLTRYGELLVDPHTARLFTELTPGVEVRGRVVGGAKDEVGGRTFLVLESTDGTVHFVPQTPEIEAFRDRDELMRGEIVTLRAVPPLQGEEARAVEVTRHGRLHELEAVRDPSTFLDLMALRDVREHGGALSMDGPSSGFAAQLRAALAGRVPLLREHGLLDAEEEAQDGKSPRFSAAPDAEEQIERAMKERERGLTPLMEVERVQGSQVAHAKLEPGRIYQGRVVAMVSDPEGTEYVVLDTGPTLAAVPAAQQRFHVDQEIRARAMAREVASEGRWTLVWQFDDLEQAQKHDRDRGR